MKTLVFRPLIGDGCIVEPACLWKYNCLKNALSRLERSSKVRRMPMIFRQ